MKRFYIVIILLLIVETVIAQDIIPEDSTIIFINRDETGQYDIYRINLDGSERINLTNTPDSDDYTIDWSPDGESIVFSSNRSGFFELYLMNAEGENVQQLTNYEADTRTPRWSPDGQSIVFQSTMNGEYDLYILNTITEETNRLTNLPQREVGASWHPSGQRLLFSYIEYETDEEGTRTRHISILGIDKNGENLIEFLSDDGASGAVWSPDGEQIVFSSNNGYGPVNLYLMNIETLDPQLLPLIVPTIGNFTPRWSPNGQLLAYENVRADLSDGIYIYDFQTGENTKVSNTIPGDGSPVWNPISINEQSNSSN